MPERESNFLKRVAAIEEERKKKEREAALASRREEPVEKPKDPRNPKEIESHPDFIRLRKLVEGKELRDALEHLWTVVRLAVYVGKKVEVTKKILGIPVNVTEKVTVEKYPFNPSIELSHGFISDEGNDFYVSYKLHQHLGSWTAPGHIFEELDLELKFVWQSVAGKTSAKGLSIYLRQDVDCNPAFQSSDFSAFDHFLDYLAQTYIAAVENRRKGENGHKGLALVKVDSELLNL